MAAAAAAEVEEEEEEQMLTAPPPPPPPHLQLLLSKERTQPVTYFSNHGPFQSNSHFFADTSDAIAALTSRLTQSTSKLNRNHAQSGAIFKI